MWVCNSPLTERTQYRSVVGQSQWLARISRTDMFLCLWGQYKVQKCNSSRCILCQQNYQKCKEHQNCIKFHSLDLKTLQLKLFTNASFNYLPNRGSQSGQIISITNDNNNLCLLYWNSSKIKRVVHSTIIVETLSLVDGCNVAIYINNLLSEL